MPPPAASAKPLTPAEIATLTRMDQEGAEYKPHWAFIRPGQSEPPHASSAPARVNAIDRFIFARLEKEGLKPFAEADKETLINRVTLTLTGLPRRLRRWMLSSPTRARTLMKRWWTGCSPRPLMARTWPLIG